MTYYVRECFKMAVNTGRESTIVAETLAQLGIDSAFQGQSNKCIALEKMLKPFDFAMSEVCTVGDALAAFVYSRTLLLSANDKLGGQFVRFEKLRNAD